MSKEAVEIRGATARTQGRSHHTPLTDIEYAEAIRFKKPAPPTFAIGGAIGSITSLWVMAACAVAILGQLLHPHFSGQWLSAAPNATHFAVWTWVPFAFTVFGATLGAVYETGLLIKGKAFQLGTLPFVQQIRYLNVAPVLFTVLAFVAFMTVPDTNLRLGILFVAGFLGAGAAFAAFFGGANIALASTLMGLQVAQIALALAFSSHLADGVALGLIVGSIAQIAALKIGTATPWASTGFHTLSTFAGVVLFVALQKATQVDSDFSNQVAIAFPLDSLLLWAFVATCIAGMVTTAKIFPQSYNNLRSIVSNGIWSVVYFFLVSQDRFPKPFNLSQVYKNGAPPRTELKPYYQQHPEFLPERLSIPAMEKLEGNVTIFKALTNQVKAAFSMIALLDHFFPQARHDVPLKDKPRMPVWSSGQEYWPTLFTKTIFGRGIPGKTLQPTPEPAIQAYLEGQLLGYLCESGVGSPLLKPCDGPSGATCMVNFRFLEKYATKPDYEPYGGIAYFRVNSQQQRLELISVVAPHDTIEIPANPHDPTFRHAESLILASLYYQVISGKHLAEIHMTHNLVEVAMHNAFDAQGQFAHPVRTFMYLHLFSHELAEELTTEHLVQNGAVFSQVFATTQDALVDHLNDAYSAFHYGDDENFELRADLMRMAPSGANDEGELLPRSAIRWELDYFNLWMRYTTSIIDATYADDQAVINDTYLQDFWQELNRVLLNALPARYDNFQTKQGVARWAADTIHHLVVRHQVYGTTGVRAALDPRINTTQVPRDGGTPGVMEWRSLACVALATARARFVMLMGDFSYLLDGVDPRYKSAMHQAFTQLQEDLSGLNKRWTASEADRQFNYDYFRATPEELHTGPGY